MVTNRAIDWKLLKMSEKTQKDLDNMGVEDSKCDYRSPWEKPPVMRLAPVDAFKYKISSS